MTTKPPISPARIDSIGMGGTLHVDSAVVAPVLILALVVLVLPVATDVGCSRCPYETSTVNVSATVSPAFVVTLTI
jgi:hypothetical protein